MFDIGAMELLVIAVVAILFVRPKDLPTMLRTIGQYVAKLRGMAREFQHQFEEAARDTGIDEIRKGISSVQDLSPASKVKDAFNSIGDDVASVQADMEAPSDKTSSETKSADKPAKKPVAKKKPTAKKKPAEPKPDAAQRKPAAAKKPGARSKASTEG